MTTEELIKRLHESLVPKGTEPIVGLRLGRTSSGQRYYPDEFVMRAIERVRAMQLGLSLNIWPTELELIGVQALLDTANIDVRELKR